jgi:hypothetical protein
MQTNLPLREEECTISSATGVTEASDPDLQQFALPLAHCFYHPA